MGYRSFFIAFFLLSCSEIWAREVIDTLESTKGDRVIIAYTVTQDKEKFVIKIRDVRKWLGQTFKNKYDKLDEVSIFFFDKTGVPKDKTKFSGIDTEAFMIPSGVNFNVSEDGYYLLNDDLTLPLELTSEESEELKIPIYLAHYEGKRRYEVFSRCRDWTIQLSKRKQVAHNPSEPVTQVTTQTITTQEEVEEPMSEEFEASILVKQIRTLLEKQDEYPFPDNLKQTHDELFDKKFRINDSKMISEIEDVLEAYESKENDLKAIADAKKKEKEIADSLRIVEGQMRQDSIAAVEKEQAEKEKKRNLWLIIGGVILGVLGFILNQVIQHFRNIKNQKNIMAMQENVVKRAENEAKRRTRNMVQGQINQAQRNVKQKTRNAVNDGIGSITKKGNKGFSI